MSIYVVEWDNVKTERTKIKCTTKDLEEAKNVFRQQVQRLKKMCESTQRNVQINLIERKEDDPTYKETLDNYW